MTHYADLIKSFKAKIIQIDPTCWVYGKYLLPINHFELCVFLDRHHMDHLNSAHFRTKNIIDAGAFIGDSALILSEYTCKNVYSFEPTSVNYAHLLKTIEMNNKQNIIPVKSGLADKNGFMELFVDESNSGLLNIYDIKSIENCQMTTLDSFVQKNNLEIGLIKTDLEGAEQLFLKGAEHTIKTQKPTVLISIYHTGSDFLGIKALIESWNLGYTFKIVKADDGLVVIETVLVCEQK